MSKPSINQEAIIDGDKKEFRRFYKEFKPRLEAYVYARTNNLHDSEEIVQDSFIGFLDSLPLFRGQSSLWTFLVSIARHEIADYFRKKYAKKALQYVPFVDQGFSEDLYSAKEIRLVFNSALKKLVKEDQKLLLWKYDKKLSVKEIAKKLDISVKACESKIFRARKAFQLAYDEVVTSNK